MDWYQIGWIVVFCLFGAALIFAMLSNLLNRIGDLYEASLRNAGIAAIRKYGADLQQQGYFFLPRDKAIVEAIAIDMNEGFTSANAPYIRDRYLPQRLAVNNPESVTEKGQPHGRDV
jgi:hypothetical protein